MFCTFSAIGPSDILCHICHVILQNVWLEEKGEASASSFVLTVISYRISGNMTGTDENRTEIDSRLLISFFYANSVVLCLFLANYGKMGRKASPFGEAAYLTGGNSNKIKESARGRR
jgi:hypothetical protein